MAVHLMPDATGAEREVSRNVPRGAWMIRDPRPEIRELFGTEWLPLPFTNAADVATVRAHVATLTPVKL